MHGVGGETAAAAAAANKKASKLKEDLVPLIEVETCERHEVVVVVVLEQKPDT